MYYIKKTSQRLLQLAYPCLIVTLLFSVQACNDDDEPKDVTLPEVTFTNLNADMEVWNTVVISLDASDDLGLSDIQIFVDDQLVATLTEAPYEVSWDSNLVPDGSHTVKVVATDKSGNSSESTVNVVVQNALLTIDIAADQLLSGEGFVQRGFVFLSDEDGNLIASAEYTNGNDLTLKSSSFNGEKFFLTEIISDFEGEAFTWVSAWTWPAIERGTDWVLFKTGDDDADYAGVAEVTLQNPAAESTYFGSTNAESFYIDETTTDLSLNLFKIPSKLFVMRDSWSDELGPLSYGLFSNLVAGNNVIDLSQVNKPLAKKTATLPEGISYYSLYMQGLPVEDDFSESYSVSYAEPGVEANSIDILYPGTAFPSYYTSLFFELPDVMYYSRGIDSESVNFDVPEVNVDLSFADSKLLYSSSGAFDFTTVRFADEAEQKRWVFFLPHGEDQFVPTLVIPTELQTMSLPGFGLPQSYSIHDFGAISSYQDLTDFVRSSTMGSDELYENGGTYLDIEYFLPSSGGRMKTDARRKQSPRLRGGLR